jgi:hypothetical protein
MEPEFHCRDSQKSATEHCLSQIPHAILKDPFSIDINLQHTYRYLYLPQNFSDYNFV